MESTAVVWTARARDSREEIRASRSYKPSERHSTTSARVATLSYQLWIYVLSFRDDRIRRPGTIRIPCAWALALEVQQSVFLRRGMGFAVARPETTYRSSVSISGGQHVDSSHDS